MLVEREQELTVLDKAVAETRAGTGTLVLVDGELGTGTTALLHRLADLATADGALVLRSGGAAGERTFPLGVVRRLILPLRTEPGPTIPPLAARLLDAEDPECEAADEPGPALLADALHRFHLLLATISTERTVVLIVDDLCWVDDASLHALAHLAARLHGLRLLLAVVRKDVLSARTPLIDEIAAAATHRVRARPLTRESTLRLVADKLGPDCPEEFALACHEVTGGRPKDLKVLCDRARLRRLGGPAWRTAALRELGGPLRRERLLLLLRREPMVDAYAKATVILGDQATDELVARLAGLSRQQCGYARHVLAMAWPGAVDATGVCDPGLAEVVLHAMSDEERARRYREASVLLDHSGAGPEEAVAPLFHVDRLTDEWEIQQLRAAAAAARHRGDPEAAVRCLYRALVDVPADSHLRAELLFELGVTELDLGAPAAARRHLAQAAGLMPRLRRRAEVVSSTPLHLVGNDPQFADLVRETAAGLGTPCTSDPQGRNLAMRLEARARYAGLYDAQLVASAARRLTELGEPGEQRGAGSPAEWELRTVLLFTATLSGQTDHRDVARTARDILDHEPAQTRLQGPALELLPPILVAADAPHVAATWLDAARLYAVREETPGPLARVEAQRGLLLLGRGEAALAREYALRAYAQAEGASPEEKLLPMRALGWIALVLEDQELACHLISNADLSADFRLSALNRALRGLRAEAHGNLSVALAQYMECGRMLERAGWLNPAINFWREKAAVIHHRLGRTAEATGLAEESHERALVWGAPTVLGRVLRLRGILTDGRRGIELLWDAVDTLESGGNRIELARTLIELGRRLQQASDSEGDRILAHGRRLADELRTLPPDPDTGPVVPSARAISAGLTPAEMKVVERAVRGLSNREIAEELDVGLRAVERHLTSSYRKLGISGRDELTIALQNNDRP